MSDHPPQLDLGNLSMDWVQWKVRTTTLEGPRIKHSQLHRRDGREHSRTACDREIPMLGDRRPEGPVIELQMLSEQSALISTRRCPECEATLR